MHTRRKCRRHTNQPTNRTKPTYLMHMYTNRKRYSEKKRKHKHGEMISLDGFLNDSQTIADGSFTQCLVCVCVSCSFVLELSVKLILRSIYTIAPNRSSRPVLAVTCRRFRPMFLFFFYCVETISNFGIDLLPVIADVTIEPKLNRSC